MSQPKRRRNGRNKIEIRKVLIVDDEACVRRFCERVIREFGCHIETAASGEEALEKIRNSGPFDLVLTDLSMPGTVNGLSVLLEAKRSSALTQVVLMTGYPTLESAVPAIKSGASDYIVKPFSPDALRSAVKSSFQDRVPSVKKIP
jgi:two-component system, cell cycle response regulator